MSTHEYLLRACQDDAVRAASETASSWRRGERARRGGNIQRLPLLPPSSLR